MFTTFIFIYSLYLQNIKRKDWAKYASSRTPSRVSGVYVGFIVITRVQPVKRNPEKEREREK